ncbi:MAG: hypothetical protein ABIH23_17455 [bacterium]
MISLRSLPIIFACAIFAAFPAWSQETPVDTVTDVGTDTPLVDTVADVGTDTTTTFDTTTIGEPAATEEGSTEVSSSLQMANQAFQMLASRQYAAAKKFYEDAAAGDPRYERMVQFVDNIMTRGKELYEEMWELQRKYENPMTPETTIYQITKEDMDKMLDFGMRTELAQGELIGEFTLAELGLDDVKDADALTLAEYLGWRRRKSVNARIYDGIMKRVLKRQMRYQRLEFVMQQKQEQVRRREELRQVRMENRGGSMGIGGGGMGGGMGSFGGGGGMGMMGGGEGGFGGGGMGMGGGFGGGGFGGGGFGGGGMGGGYRGGF